MVLAFTNEGGSEAPKARREGIESLTAKRGYESSALLLRTRELSAGLTASQGQQPVDDFVLRKASDFNKSQQLSTSGLQQIQYQSLKNLKFKQELESGSGSQGARSKSTTVPAGRRILIR
jgi:hypothetical protein